MRSYKKKSGFTIAELAIVMTLTVVVLGIIWTMFSTSNKIISDVTIKSDLQKEGQGIQEKISNIGMQSTGIESVYKNDLETIQTIQIKSYYKSQNTADSFYIIYDDTNKKLYTCDKSISMNNINHELLTNTDYKLLSDNVDSFKINNEDIINVDENTLKNINSVEFTITLSKKKTYNNEQITHSVKVRTVFRNKGILSM